MFHLYDIRKSSLWLTRTWRKKGGVRNENGATSICCYLWPFTGSPNKSKNKARRSKNHLPRCHHNRILNLGIPMLFHKYNFLWLLWLLLFLLILCFVAITVEVKNLHRKAMSEILYKSEDSRQKTNIRHYMNEAIIIW